jgi:hypothetical protein
VVTQLTRSSAEEECIVFFSTEDGTAENGLDYQVSLSTPRHQTLLITSHKALP